MDASKGASYGTLPSGKESGTSVFPVKVQGAGSSSPSPGAAEEQNINNKETEKLIWNPAGTGSKASDNSSSSSSSSISSCTAIFLVVNYMIGSGILNTPQTFKDSGIAATTVLYILAGLAVWVGSVVLVKAAEDEPQSASEDAMVEEGGDGKNGGSGANGSGNNVHKKHEYAKLAADSLGDNGPSIVDLSITLQNAGAVCSYIVILGGLVTSLVMEVYKGEVWWDSFYALTILVALLILVPSSWDSLAELWPLAVFSLSTIVMLLVFVIGNGIKSHLAAGGVGETVLDAPLVWWNWMGCFRKVGSVVFGITFAPAAFHAFEPMKKRNLSEWKYVVTTSVLVGGFLCFSMGLAGYLSFGQQTGGDILDNFSGPWASLLKVFVIVHLIFYVPGEVIVLRDSVFGLFKAEKKSVKTIPRVASTFAILAAIVFTVSLLTAFGLAQGEAFGYILDFTGGVTASLTSFVLPAVIYLRGSERPRSAAEPRDGYRLASKVLLLFGAALIVIVLSAIFHNTVVTAATLAAVSYSLFRNRSIITTP